MIFVENVSRIPDHWRNIDRCICVRLLFFGFLIFQFGFSKRRFSSRDVRLRCMWQIDLDSEKPSASQTHSSWYFQHPAFSNRRRNCDDISDEKDPEQAKIRRPFKCGICDKSFMRAVALRDHMSLHKGSYLDYVAV